MYLSEVKLYNWRKYKTKENGSPGLVVHFKKGLNILIGENDSGKTAIIDAIRMTLGTNSRTSDWINDEDFSLGTDNLQIECIFKGLTEKEEAYFFEWLSLKGENLDQVSLRVVLRANKYKDANKIEKINKEILAGPEGYETGINSIAQEYLRVTYLKPLRDAESELKPGYRSRVAKVIEGLKEFQDESKKNNIIENFHNAFQTFNDELNDPVLNKINNHLENFLSMSDTRTAQVQNKSFTFQEILRRLEVDFDEGKSGLGSTNLLFMALELVALREQEIGVQLTLIEEIEAHLHPQAQLRVIKAFETYLEENPSIHAQYILTTHSPVLASSVNLENLILNFENNVFSMRKEFTKLRADDYHFLNRFLDATKANLFFAKGVILVEGFAENILVPAVAEAIGRPLHQYGISIVNVQGTRFNRYIPIFLRKSEKMNFPVSVITDMDISPTSYYLFKTEESKKLYSQFTEPINSEELNRKLDIQEINNHFRVWDYRENQIKWIREEIEDNKKKEFYDGEENIRVFLSSPWTLEHSIAKSTLREEFEKIIIDLAEYKKVKTKEEKLENWRKIEDSHKRATETYQFVINKKISKTIIAQQLASKIKNKDDIEKDSELNFIVDAIKHVTGGLKNENNKN